MPDRKPLRMRAACGQCHSAKVKCSGERTGCTRCAKLGLQCEYGVSMVGRASKRKNHDVEEDVNHDDTINNDASDPNLTADQQWFQAEGLQPDRDALMFASGTDPSLQLLPQDLLSITGLDDFSFHAFPDHHNHGDPQVFGSIDGSWPTVDSSPEANMASFTATPQDSSPSDQPPNKRRPLPADFPEKPMSLSDDFDRLYNPVSSLQPIFVFARITQYLENQLKDEALPLDRTLTIVKSSLAEIMLNVGNGSALVSIGCRALIFAAIQNIVRLYSRALLKHRQGATGEPLATWKLGSFEIDPEDQLKLQNQAIAAELGRCVRQIKTLAANWSKACDRGEQCRGVKAYHNIEKGLTEMQKDVETAQIEQISSDLEKTTVHDKRLVHPLI